MSSVTSAVSSVSQAVGERVDKSTIPFALKGVLVGAGAAIVIAAAIILIWRPSTSPAPVAQAQTVPAATPVSAAAPCGWSQDSMFSARVRQADAGPRTASADHQQCSERHVRAGKPKRRGRSEEGPF